jgi:hypothetical protein
MPRTVYSRQCGCTWRVTAAETCRAEQRSAHDHSEHVGSQAKTTRAQRAESGQNSLE